MLRLLAFNTAKCTISNYIHNAYSPDALNLCYDDFRSLYPLHDYRDNWSWLLSELFLAKYMYRGIRTVKINVNREIFRGTIRYIVILTQLTKCTQAKCPIRWDDKYESLERI